MNNGSWYNNDATRRLGKNRGSRSSCFAVSCSPMGRTLPHPKKTKTHLSLSKITNYNMEETQIHTQLLPGSPNTTKQLLRNTHTHTHTKWAGYDVREMSVCIGQNNHQDHTRLPYGLLFHHKLKMVVSTWQPKLNMSVCQLKRLSCQVHG